MSAWHPSHASRPAAAPRQVPISWIQRQQADTLALSERQQFVERLLAAQTALLDAPERKTGEVLAEAVHPYVARLELRYHSQYRRQIVRVQVRRQPVVPHVRKAEDLIFVVPCGDGHDRAEDLLTENPHVLGDSVEHGRLDEEALLQPGGPAASCQDLGAILATGRDVLDDPVVLNLRDESADVGIWVLWRADAHVRQTLHQVAAELLV